MDKRKEKAKPDPDSYGDETIEPTVKKRKIEKETFDEKEEARINAVLANNSLSREKKEKHVTFDVIRRYLQYKCVNKSLPFRAAVWKESKRAIIKHDADTVVDACLAHDIYDAMLKMEWLTSVDFCCDVSSLKEMAQYLVKWASQDGYDDAPIVLY